MMIRTSLAWKFILALMLVSLTVAALVVFAIRQMSVSQLQSLIIEQEHALLAEELVNYYERVGSWDGLERYIRQQYPPGPAPLPLILVRRGSQCRHLMHHEAVMPLPTRRAGRCCRSRQTTASGRSFRRRFWRRAHPCCWRERK